MQAQAYEGYFENGQFYPIGQIEHTSGRVRAFLTVFGETAQADTISYEKKASAQEWLDEFYGLLSKANSELREEDFPRMALNRNPELLINEE
jgi:hypothetical protein